MNMSAPKRVPTKGPAQSQAFHKRKAHDMSVDDFTSITIQTPSADGAGLARRMMKNRPVGPTALGEKSTFSITPFLNRSKASEDSPEQEEEDELVNDSILGTQHSAQSLKMPVIEPEEEPEPEPESGSDAAPPEEAEAEPDASGPSAAEEDDQPKPRRGRPKKALAEAPSAKKNTQLAPKKTAAKTSKKASLEKLSTKTTEADDKQEEREASKSKSPDPAAAAAAAPVEKEKGKGKEEKKVKEKKAGVKFNFTLPQDTNIKVPNFTGGGNGTGNGASASASAPAAEQPKKKKRKVLGSTKTQTLFDEEDAEETAGPTQAAPAALKRKPSKVQLGAAGGGTKNLAKAPLGLKRVMLGAATASSTFSPLKRDRRGVGASFLA